MDDVGVDVVVRRVRADEIDTLREVRLAALSDSPSAFASTYAQERALTDHDWAERARLSASGSERATFLAVDGESVVGLVGGYRRADSSGEVELISMWTDPSARRAGVGRLLVGAVLGWARSVGADRVDLWVVRGNRAAESLYRSLGFTETEECKPVPSDPCREELRMTIAV